MNNKHILAALLIILNNCSKELRIYKDANVDSIIETFNHIISEGYLKTNNHRINVMSLDSCINEYQDIHLKLEENNILSCDMNGCIKIGSMKINTSIAA